MNPIFFFRNITLIITILFLPNLTYAKTIYYVTQNGMGDGSSWKKASGDIQIMIEKASSGDEVWVAKGTYKPHEINTKIGRQFCFFLKEGVSLYGGFSGSENSISQRILFDIDKNGKIESYEFLNESVLDGDDNIPDVWTKQFNKNGKDWEWNVTGNYANFQVVKAYDLGLPEIIFDGFSVVNGSSTYSEYGGGGILVINSNVKVRNSTIHHCSSVSAGGGICFIYSSSTLPINRDVYNCKVYNCFSSSTSGGGIYLYGEAYKCDVSSCTAASGGGLGSYHGGKFTNCTVYDCCAEVSGGGIYGNAIDCYVNNCHAGDKNSGITPFEYGGGIFGTALGCYIINCTAENGGGFGGPAISRSKIINCTASKLGGGVYGGNVVSNCLISNCYAIIGGGIYNVEVGGWGSGLNFYTTNCTITNCGSQLYGKKDAIEGANNFDNKMNFSITNCVFANNEPAVLGNGNFGGGFVVSNCAIFTNNSTACTFVRPSSFLGFGSSEIQINEITNANWQLCSKSQCINSGVLVNIANDYFIKGESVVGLLDVEGNTRVIEKLVDIGAYEFNSQKCITKYSTEEIEVCLGESYNGWTTSGQFQRNLNSINGCDSIVTTKLIVNVPIKPTLSVKGDTLICSPSFVSYKWFDKNGEITGANSSKYIIKKSGYFYVKVTTTTGCSNVSAQINMIKTNTTKELDISKPQFYVLPNPSFGIFKLKIENCQAKDLNVQLLDVIGRLYYVNYYSKKEISNFIQFDISDLPKGNYLLKISGRNFVETKKIFLQ